MPPPLITVLVDTYNYGCFVEEAIDSVLSQDFPEAQREVLVVDDGSTDETAERVKKYGSKIRYFYKTNGGQASAFNFGFSRARGEIIALLDGDDYWLPGKLARIADEFEKHPNVGMIYHRFLEVDMKTDESREASSFRPISGWLYDDRAKFSSYQAPGTSAAFRRSSLSQLLPIPEHLRTQADGYIGLLIPFVAPIMAIPECLAVYRHHGRNLYHAEGPEIPVEFRKRRMETAGMVIALVKGWLRKNGYTGELRDSHGFLNRLSLALEEELFFIEPPGRGRLFWFLLRQTHARSRGEAWEPTAFSYIAALAALAFGYRNWSTIYRWRCELLGITTDLFRRIVRSTPAAVITAAQGRKNHVSNR